VISRNGKGPVAAANPSGLAIAASVAYLSSTSDPIVGK
jgi:hypothetical protein